MVVFESKKKGLTNMFDPFSCISSSRTFVLLSLFILISNFMVFVNASSSARTVITVNNTFIIDKEVSSYTDNDLLVLQSAFEKFVIDLERSIQVGFRRKNLRKRQLKLEESSSSLVLNTALVSTTAEEDGKEGGQRDHLHHIHPEQLINRNLNLILLDIPSIKVSFSDEPCPSYSINTIKFCKQVLAQYDIAVYNSGYQANTYSNSFLYQTYKNATEDAITDDGYFQGYVDRYLPQPAAIDEIIHILGSAKYMEEQYPTYPLGTDMYRIRSSFHVVKPPTEEGDELLVNDIQSQDIQTLQLSLKTLIHQIVEFGLENIIHQEVSFFDTGNSIEIDNYVECPKTITKYYPSCLSVQYHYDIIVVDPNAKTNNYEEGTFSRNDIAYVQIYNLTNDVIRDGTLEEMIRVADFDSRMEILGAIPTLPQDIKQIQEYIEAMPTDNEVRKWDDPSKDEKTNTFWKNNRNNMIYLGSSILFGFIIGGCLYCYMTSTIQYKIEEEEEEYKEYVKKSNRALRVHHEVDPTDYDMTETEVPYE